MSASVEILARGGIDFFCLNFGEKKNAFFAQNPFLLCVRHPELMNNALQS
jgi:hypothetical protein